MDKPNLKSFAEAGLLALIEVLAGINRISFPVLGRNDKRASSIYDMFKRKGIC